MSNQFKLLFSPIKIGSMTVRNRIVVPGHYPALNDPDTLPGQRITAYWESKAKGGAGMICTGIWGVHTSSPTPAAAGFELHESLRHSPLQIPGGIDRLKRTTETIKKHGTCFLVQLWHGGSQAYGAARAGDPHWAPSALPTLTGSVPHAMTTSEIKLLIEAFAAEAYRCQQAGVDGVEFHGAHGYLGTQFMSSIRNVRDDEYGRDHEGRIRFATEVIDAIRAVVGKDFVIGLRISVDELGGGGGYNSEDTKEMARYLVRSGNLDYITTGAAIPPTYFPTGSLMYHAAALKEVVDIPVIGGGRINDPVQAEQALENRWADLIFMNRAIICDPELPNKAREGRLDEIRKCMGDSEGCWMRVSQESNTMGVSCSYNPTVGKETIPGWLELIPAAKKKKVMVIGGGPAGLETARVARARGHDVSLWEKGPELGGMVQVAAKAPSREDLGELPRYYRHQMKMLGVNVHLNSEATLETVRAENPDVVVVATGSVPLVPNDIKGIDQANVIQSVRDVLMGRVEVGQNVLIADVQQHIQGLSTADFLSQQGKKVEIIFPYERPGAEMELITRWALLQRLGSAEVKLTPHTMLKRVAGNTVVVVDTQTKTERTINDIDTVVLSYGGKANSSLYHALEGKVPEVYSAGDCRTVRKIMWATNDGAQIGRAI